jgi:hypothetical protein
MCLTISPESARYLNDNVIAEWILTSSPTGSLKNKLNFQY